MAALTIAILATEGEQLDILQALVDATATGRTVMKEFPSDFEAVSRKLKEIKPHVLLVDIPPVNSSSALRTIEALHSAFPQMPIFASGEMSKRQNIVEAMRSGACEFLERPPSTTSLLEAFARLAVTQRKNADDPNRGKVITVVNAKGGCGATTVAVNTAVALNESHGSTALVDLAPIGHAALHLNARPTFGLNDALQNAQRLDGSLLDGFMTRCGCGIHLLAGPEVPSPVKVTEEDMGRLFDVMVHHYRYVVVDASSRLDALVRMACTFSDMILMIAETDMIGLLWNAARVQSFLGENSTRDKVRLVLNRFRKSHEFSDADAEAATDAKILWKVPSQYFVVGAAIDRGIPVVLQKNAEVGRSFRGLASALAQYQAKPVRRRLTNEYASRIRALSTT